MATERERLVAETDLLLDVLRRVANRHIKPVLQAALSNDGTSASIVAAVACLARDMIGSMVVQTVEPGHECDLVERLLDQIKEELTRDPTIWDEIRVRLATPAAPEVLS